MCQVLFIPRPRHCIVTPGGSQSSQPDQHGPSPAKYFLVDGQCFFPEGLRCPIVALVKGHPPKIVERERQAPSVSQFALYCDALLKKGARPWVVTLKFGQTPQIHEGQSL